MKFCDLWLLYTVHYILSSSKLVGGINFKAGNQWVASWSSNTPVPVKNGFVEVARWLILGHMMRFSLQSSLAMPTTRLIFLFFLLILPNNSSTYQRRRKPDTPVCPKAFHLIGKCADKKQPNTIGVVQEESVITMLASSWIGSEQYRLNCSFGTQLSWILILMFIFFIFSFVTPLVEECH